MTFSDEPQDKHTFTENFDREYSRFATLYDTAVKVLPIWKTWLRSTIPHIEGPRVLEVSFGTGYLLSRYAGDFETSGIDYNEKMVPIARKNLERKGISAQLRRGNVEELPYDGEMFDTVVNTMAFSGYPNANKAMSELRRVLKTGGKIVMLDINYPANRNWVGMNLTKMWMTTGDLIRDMKPLFEKFHFDSTDEEIGGFGSVHLYIARKRL